MRRGLTIIAGAVLMVAAIGGIGHAANPASISVSPTNASSSWTGASFLAGATASPTACPPSLDPANALCDHVSLDVGVAPAYWDAHTGQVRIGISWADAADNFDLFVYNGSGTQVGSSTQSGSSSETVTLASAAGGYEIRVVPVLVTSSGYAGTVTFAAQAIPSPTPSPTPTGGSGGSGSGGTGGAGGSGTGTGGSGGTGTGGTGTAGGSLTIPPPNYSLGSFSGSNPGGLFYAPWSSGGGTTYFGSNGSGSTQGQVYYASAYGGQVSNDVADQVAKGETDRPVSSVLARTTVLFWVLLAVGLLLLAGVTYLIVEPEGDGRRVVSVGHARARLPVPPVLLAGPLVRGLASGGRYLVHRAHRILKRQSTT
jgi:hypothetical protein